jgi:hypothetical protein
MATMKLKDQDRSSLRRLLMEGAASKPGKAAKPGFFDSLRKRVRRNAGK